MRELITECWSSSYHRQISQLMSLYYGFTWAPFYTNTHTDWLCSPTHLYMGPPLPVYGRDRSILEYLCISVNKCPCFFFFLILSLNLWVLFFFENHCKFWQLKAFCYSLLSTFFTSTLILENVSSDRFNSIEVFPQNLVIFILVQGRVVHKYVRSWILLKGFPFPLCNW